MTQILSGAPSAPVKTEERLAESTSRFPRLQLCLEAGTLVTHQQSFTVHLSVFRKDTQGHSELNG